MSTANSDYYNDALKNKKSAGSINNYGLVEFFKQFKEEIFLTYKDDLVDTQIYSTFLIKNLRLNSELLNSKLNQQETEQLEAQIIKLVETLIYRYFSKALSGFEKDDTMESKARSVYFKDFAESICRNLFDSEKYHLRELMAKLTVNTYDVWIEEQVLGILQNRLKILQHEDPNFLVMKFVQNSERFLTDENRTAISKILKPGAENI